MLDNSFPREQPKSDQTTKNSRSISFLGEQSMLRAKGPQGDPGTQFGPSSPPAMGQLVGGLEASDVRSTAENRVSGFQETRLLGCG